MSNELVFNPLVNKIIGCAIEVHKTLGPGLLESSYQKCFCHELNINSISYKKELALPIEYKGVNLDCGYRIDVFVENEIVVELKSVEKLLPIHEAQLLTYLRLMNIRQGLLINFNGVRLKDGIKSLLNPYCNKIDN